MAFQRAWLNGIFENILNADALTMMINHFVCRSVNPKVFFFPCCKNLEAAWRFIWGVYIFIFCTWRSFLFFACISNCVVAYCSWNGGYNPVKTSGGMLSSSWLIFHGILKILLSALFNLASHFIFPLSREYLSSTPSPRLSCLSCHRKTLTFFGHWPSSFISRWFKNINPVFITLFATQKLHFGWTTLWI